MSNFYKNLNRIRSENGITQAELARRLRVDRSTVSYWENGRNEPNIDVLINICNALNCDIKDLIY